MDYIYNRYKELKEKQKLEINVLPFFFFELNEERFDADMRSFGLPDDFDAIFELASKGGVYSEMDFDCLDEMFRHQTFEMLWAIKDDATGDSFIYDMFLYELENHDFVHTHNLTDTLDALIPFTYVQKILADKRLLHGLRKALAELRRREEEQSRDSSLHSAKAKRQKAVVVTDDQRSSRPVFAIKGR